MSSQEAKLDVLDRSKLIKLAEKLDLDVSNFNNPYRKKEYIKNEILKALKTKNSLLCNRNVCNSVIPKCDKLVCIGDIHGDLCAAIKCLKLAKVIPLSVPNNTQNVNNIKWIGKNTIVVQLGDQIDRCRPSNWVDNICVEDDEEIYEDEGSDLKIICLFDNLHKQAIKENGGVYSILGNHELMNVDGDFRYVSPREFREFGNFFKAKKTAKKTQNKPFGYKERLTAFSPGGIIAKKMGSCRYSVLQVGRWLFVHGGIAPETALKYSLNDINKYVKNWLYGIDNRETKDAISYLYHNDDDNLSPFWSRLFSDVDEWNKSKEKLFLQTLNNLNTKNGRCDSNEIKGMIMGHSPQYMFNRGINHDCNKTCWRVDVGMSRAFGPLHNKNDETKYRKVQILVIEDDEKCRVIKEK